MLNVLCRRFEEVQGNNIADLAINCNQLLAEIQALHEMFEGMISTDDDYIAEVNYVEVVAPASDINHEENTTGRPRKSMTREEIERLYNIYKSWKDVAAHFHVSEKTIQRR